MSSRPPSAHSQVKEPGNVGILGYVAVMIGGARRRRANGCGSGFALFVIDVPHEDMGAFGSEGLRDCVADPVRRTGDDSNFVL
jgi:hypothetical protein